MLAPARVVRRALVLRKELHTTLKTKVLQANSSTEFIMPLRRLWHHAASAEHLGNSRRNGVFAFGILATATLITSHEAMCEREDNREDELCNDRWGTQNSLSIYLDAEYEPKKLLGAGAFGVVMECVQTQTGRMAAVKMVQNNAENIIEIKREKLALERLESAGGHVSIVGYEGSYESNDYHYTVLEHVRGASLYSFMKKHRQLDTTRSLQCISQLASALEFMHQEDIIHRDLKPDNIMVRVHPNRTLNQTNEEVMLKIIDFGSAGRVSQPESVDTAHTSTLSGTRCYWSPEVLEHHDMTPALDMWALGCILYILIAGCHPFDLTGASTEDEVLQRVKTEPVSFKLPVWHGVSTEIKNLIRGLLEKNPQYRLSAKQVLTHPAINEKKCHVEGVGPFF
ncbi:hypothetical protein CCR75_001891 [Bremia lactucae]|uniref:Protein kinase domain-containing protein n=1 Tax=Bremia lactucae TaxID=4779 RepID=A0A976FIC2_BRELC|nr:hypothetical protein CCR75_001891 [Bremia lactucae]